MSSQTALQSRRVAVVAIAAAAFLLGVWFGEAGAGVPSVAQLLLVPLSAVVAATVAPGQALVRSSAAALVATLLVAGWIVGARGATAAFNACVSNGETVRQSLASHRSRHGRFPNSLADLGAPVPCSRFLRGSLLTYNTTGATYDLYFGDHLTTHHATDAHGFAAHK
ncbi:MAG: hypothetical protein AMXMBFR56_81320 [Polyangiaceae bacterium]